MEELEVGVEDDAETLGSGVWFWLLRGVEVGDMTALDRIGSLLSLI